MGVVAWALLKLLRLADTRTETAVWTAVLLAALAMPVLRHALPSFILMLPHLPAAAASLSVATQPGVSGSVLRAVSRSGSVHEWLMHHGQSLLLAGYAAGLSVCLARITAGLCLTWRIYRSAVPVAAPWAAGRNIRATDRLKSPVSVASVILLTSDYREWSMTKRDAVLAHEGSHIARRDFFVQLAASIHCALFWFSPFAWWLQTKLAEIAETASDDAAIQCLEDRIAYAEILIDVSRSAQTTPMLVGMAKRHFIDQRVEHILFETPPRSASLPLRGGLLVVFAALTVIVASATVRAQAMRAQAPIVIRTPVPPAPSVLPAMQAAALASDLRPELTVANRPSSGTSSAAASSAAASSAAASSAAAPPADEITYNPRALLDSRYVPWPDHVPPSTVAHAGKLFYVRSTEKPVADATIAYGLEHELPHANQGDATLR